MIYSNNALKQSYNAPEVEVIDTDIQCGIAASPDGLIDDWTEKDPIQL